MVSSTIVFAPLQQMAVCAKLSHVQLRVTAWTVALQAPLSMGFSGQEYWSGLPCPPPGDLSEPGIEGGSPALQADSLSLSHLGIPCLALLVLTSWLN